MRTNSNLQKLKKDSSFQGSIVGILVLAIGFVFPLALLALYSIWTYDPLLVMVPEVTFGNYVQLFTNPHSLAIFFRTLSLALIATVICFVIGYTVASYLRTAGPKERSIIIITVLSPILMSDVIIGYAFLVILGRQGGTLSQLLNKLNLLDGPLELLGTNTAVLIGLVYVGLGFMIINLYASLETMGHNEQRAAAVLGANGITRFMKVTLPLSLPGVLSGGLVTFSVTASAFVIPRMMGGGTAPIMSGYIYDLNTYTLNWPLGAAAAVSLLIVTLSTAQVFVRLISMRDPKRRAMTRDNKKVITATNVTNEKAMSSHD